MNMANKKSKKVENETMTNETMNNSTVETVNTTSVSAVAVEVVNTTSIPAQNVITLDNEKNTATVMINDDFVPSVASGEIADNQAILIEFMKDTKDSVKSTICNVVETFTKASNAMKRAYTEMLPKVAIIHHNKYYKNVISIKSSNQFLVKFTGMSAQTASEMIKVVERFYTNTGALSNPIYEVFTYSELIKLAECDDTVLNTLATYVSEKVKETGKKPTRADIMEKKDEILSNLLAEATSNANTKIQSKGKKKETIVETTESGETKVTKEHVDAKQAETENTTAQVSEGTDENGNTVTNVTVQSKQYDEMNYVIDTATNGITNLLRIINNQYAVNAYGDKFIDTFVAECRKLGYELGLCDDNGNEFLTVENDSEQPFENAE